MDPTPAHLQSTPASEILLPGLLLFGGLRTTARPTLTKKIEHKDALRMI